MFVDVIVPVSVPNTYTYGVPIEFQEDVCVGMRVEVEFGKRKRYAAVICRIHYKKPTVYEAKPILSLIDQTPLITTQQLQFWNWISHYYMANIGDVLTAALPTALKLTSETTIELLVAEDSIDTTVLNDEEFMLLEALSQHKKLTTQQIQEIIQRENIFPLLQRMIDLHIIRIKETLKEKYKVKTEWFARVKPKFATPGSLHSILDELERAVKQQEAFLYYLSKTKHNAVWIPKKEWKEQANVSYGVLNALLEREFFEVEEREVDRIEPTKEGDLRASLSIPQQKAFEEIQHVFTQKKPALLFGVTGSGKTHIYIKLIEEVLAQNKQTLYLLPEIALTTQIITRLQQHFGTTVGVYHSKFNDAERVEVWNKCLQGDYKIIVGARSALFLPFHNLELVIVDEEHDNSFKQFNPSPRYNARDAALWLAHKNNARIVLGSATPSFESYFNTQQNKYGLVELNERFGESNLPEIEIINLNKQYIPGKTYSNFSKRLIDVLRECVADGKQAILFRNRRGYSSIVQCTACGHSIKCENCDVSLTYHKYRDDLECHYCGFRQKMPYRCSACGHNDLQKFGLGTQRIEEELNVFIPTAKFGRMDLDTTRGKFGHQKIINRFERKEIDILVGTQMVTKGLHFEDVRIVGIINADALIQFPDFRAGEKALQLLEQVSGRAGRHEENGLVLVQVRDERSPVLSFLKEHNYIGYYHATLNERWKYHYPPFYRQINITCKHRDWKGCYEAALLLTNTIRKKTNQHLKGPSEPLVSRINNWYLQELIVTMEKNPSIIHKTKQIIQESIDFVQQQKGMSQVRINVDVDPM